MEEREQATHSNKDIDTALTKFNAQGPGTYRDICDKYDSRIAALDAAPGANRRKDRVTCFGLSVPVPDGMTDTLMQAEWMGKVIGLVGDQYGADNVLQYFAHWDEMHDYTDAETGETRTSRGHLHAFVMPEHDGKLNGKWFSSKANMVKLNEAIQDMTQRDYGMDFMDGTKKKSRKEVETLKNESLSREIESKQSQLATLETDIATMEAKRAALRDKMQDELDEARGKYKWLQEAHRTATSKVWALQEAQGHRDGGAALMAAVGASVAALTAEAGKRAPVRSPLASRLIAADEARWGTSPDSKPVEYTR